MGAMFDELVSFYTRSGIFSTSFSCQHLESCRGSCASFTEAKSAYVGPEYEREARCRVSLDSGSADRDPKRWTPEAVRRQEVACDVGSLHQGKHWYRTHELAWVLLRQFDEELRVYIEALAKECDRYEYGLRGWGRE